MTTRDDWQEQMTLKYANEPRHNWLSTDPREHEWLTKCENSGKIVLREIDDQALLRYSTSHYVMGKPRKCDCGCGRLVMENIPESNVYKPQPLNVYKPTPLNTYKPSSKKELEEGRVPL